LKIVTIKILKMKMDVIQIVNFSQDFSVLKDSQHHAFYFISLKDFLTTTFCGSFLTTRRSYRSVWNLQSKPSQRLTGKAWSNWVSFHQLQSSKLRSIFNTNSQQINFWLKCRTTKKLKIRSFMQVSNLTRKS
jgi:hypothetical protein